MEYNENMVTGLVIPLIAGWVGGWVVNYLADVLPFTRRFSQPTCPHCDTTYPWQDYLTFHACRSCGKKRRFRTWIVQLFLVAASVYIWISPPGKIGFALGLLLLLYFSIAFVIDLEHRLILHPTSIFGALLGLGVGTLHHGLVSTLIGGLAGFGIMFLFYLFGILFARMRARRMQAAGQATDDEEALGMGDVILSTILGLILGWPMIWFGLLLGILLGGAISVLLLLGLFVTGQYKEKAWMVFIPYGPYFILSAFLLIYLPTWIKMVVPK
ncbi:MAG: prepilin peptidase [Chloroflexi bacterium]|nr:MAG: prepilin peptidase [Chloroflexota bacterium]